MNLERKHKIAQFFYSLYLKRQEYRYVYRIDVVKPNPRRKRLKKSFVTLRLVKLFYLTLKYKQFRTIARKAAKRDDPLKRIIVWL